MFINGLIHVVIDHLLKLKKYGIPIASHFLWTVHTDSHFLKEAFFQSDCLMEQICRLYIKRLVKQFWFLF